MPVIPTLGRQRQEDCEFKGSLGHIVSCCLKKSLRKREGGERERERERERLREIASSLFVPPKKVVAKIFRK
jgi:hypothetical protein